MTIRVLHIIGSLGLGGAQVCLKQLVENNDDPDVEHFIYPLRSRQIDIPVKGNIIKLPYRNYDPRKFFAIFSLCKKYKIDIIHAHLHKAIIGALAARFFCSVPVIVHEHGSIAMKGFQYSLYRLMLRIFRSNAQQYIAVSNSTANDLHRYSKIPLSAIRVIYNAVDMDEFSPKPDLRKSIRKKLAISDSDIVIGFVGRLSYEKGPDLLLDAFGLLIQKNPDLMLVFLGDGEMKRALNSKAATLGLNNRVKCLGFRNDVAHVMNAFDIGCISSRQEAFGIAAIEYMSMRIPIVSSNVCGLAELVTHQYNALVPEENTPLQVCRCLEELIGDEKLRLSLIENGFSFVRQFDVSKLVTNVNPIYRTLLKRD